LVVFKLGTGFGWIEGYWSGRSQDNNNNHAVGSTTDAEGIIGEAKKVCQRQPSLTFFKATGIVYSDFADHSRQERS
jgi:hypothetical protein